MRDDEVSEIGLADMVKGCNPKMCYANCKLANRRAFLGRPMARPEVRTEMAKYIEEFDESVALQQRCSDLFQARLRERRLQAQAASQKASGESSTQGDRDVVWQQTMQATSGVEDAPIASGLLAKFYEGMTFDDIVKLSTNMEKLIIFEKDTKPHRGCKQSLWGCGGEWHNACCQELSANRRLRAFKTIQPALNSFIDSFKPKEVKTTDILLHFFSVSGDGPCTLGSL